MLKFGTEKKMFADQLLKPKFVIVYPLCSSLICRQLLILMLSFKVHERTASLEKCPWCTSKGLTYSLRSYRINLQESITLCTNPQCLFPLVSQPLEDVLASLVPAEPTVRSKRKNALALETEEPDNAKRQRSDESDSHGPVVFTETHTGQEVCNERIVVNGQHSTTETDDGKENGRHRVWAVQESTTIPAEGGFMEGKPENGAGTEDSPSTSAGVSSLNSPSALAADGEEPQRTPDHESLCPSKVESDSRPATNTIQLLHQRIVSDSSCSSLTNEDARASKICAPSLQEEAATVGREKKTVTTDIGNCEGTRDVKVETAGPSQSQEPKALVGQPFWRNSDNLCWLDALLVVLVNCNSLKAFKPKDEPQKSAVWRLMQEYANICASLETQQQTKRDGRVEVPRQALQKVNTDLHMLRMSIFKQLQPLLHCKLGQRETPVFALPLLLAMDSWAEPLFQSSFHWEFSCSGCKIFTKERVTKTLPTCANIVRDWCPLQAVHLAPCNACPKRNQHRTMMLERVPAVFALHFVEGLPDNDVRIYSFAFGGKRYSITSVIQYDQHLKHFVPWIRKLDGSWLEFDDLKHPDCKTHQKLPVPAHEMHIVFWEADQDAEPSACSPTSGFTESPPAKPGADPILRNGAPSAGEATPCMPDQSLLISHDDTDILHALSPDNGNAMETTATAGVDTSIGSTTLLETFEGLSHNDIVTLTLTEVTNPEIPPLGDSEPTNELLSRSETLAPPPDSSSVVSASEMSEDLPQTSSDESCSDSADPTYVPCTRKTRGRPKGAAKSAPKQQKGRRAAKTKAALTPTEPATDEKPVGDASPAKASKPVSPASSNNTSPQSSNQLTSFDQNARWSFLLSKHPLNPPKSSPKSPLTPVAKMKPPSTSTPSMARRPPIPVVQFHKPHLRKEDGDGLPLKAAERYDAFSARTPSAPSVPAPPTFHQGKTNGTAMPAPSLPLLGAKSHLEITTLKKQSSQTAKVPPGLSETEALRYKLMKKLKAKKKKLAKLNAMLGQQGGASLQPDSTDLGSPSTVTSSTYDGSNCDELLSDLLSPATTASNLSPDSSGFLDVLASRQDGVDHLDGIGYSVSEAPHGNTFITPNNENFLDEYLAQAVAQQPTQMEEEALGALDLFF